MILKLKSKIQEFENRFRKINMENALIRSSQAELEKNQQVILDFYRLNSLFPESNFVPYTSWSVSPGTILHLINDIYFNDRKCIIEFGSGASTLYLAQYIKKNDKNIKYYCVESDKEWLEKVRDLSIKHGTSENIIFVHAPLTEIKEGFAYKEQSIWYDTKTLFKEFNSQKFDLVIVDGPIGFKSPYIRYSAIPVLQNFLSPNLSIFLDDTNRQDEMEIINEWKIRLKLQLKHFGKYSVLTNDVDNQVQNFSLKGS